MAAVPQSLGSFVDAAGPRVGPVKRWDGAARGAYDWDGLRKDPALWTRNGNCLVYLYGKGLSRRGPSFKIPFQELLDKKCFPLIQRFLATEGPVPRSVHQLEQWAADPKRTIELYIPPPLAANRSQAYAYHIATRNFFAWILRRSVVGERLGHALVGLLHSMHEFRSDVKDNMDDLVDYMDEEGYLDVAHQPDHALALLFLAETFQQGDLYIRAFSHCVGMSDVLFTSLEYHQITFATKKLIRKARLDLETRLCVATERLRDFLDEELSATRLGIPPAARAHLERFRSFLLSFYAARLGYYPPRLFEPSVCLGMRRDFEALYNLLADETYPTTEGTPSVASGGICTLQLVQTFDKDYGLDPLEHPLPLLPELNRKDLSQRVPWRTRSDKLRPDQRLLAHAALIKASNWKKRVFQSDLVREYRSFEEDFALAASKTEKQEKVSVADARKVRWILIYTVYQVLRSVTEIPPEVYDAEEAEYHLAVSTADLPPWSATLPRGHLLRRQTELVTQKPSASSLHRPGSSRDSSSVRHIEIRPDVDYYALTHPKPLGLGRTVSMLEATSAATPSISRQGSMSSALQRNSTVRRSMKMFRPSASSPPPQASARSRNSHHEILVKGYGNGLNYVKVGPMDMGRIDSVPERNNSTGSHSGSCGSMTPPESTDSGDTLESSVLTPSNTPPTAYWEPEPLRPEPTVAGRPPRREVMSMLLGSSGANSMTSSSSVFKRPVSALLSRSSSMYSHSNYNSNGNSRSASARPSRQNMNQSYSEAYEQLIEEQRESMLGGASGTASPAGDSRRHSAHPHILDDDWSVMQAFMDGAKTRREDVDDDGDMKPAWEQYADLGGLTEM